MIDNTDGSRKLSRRGLFATGALVLAGGAGALVWAESGGRAAAAGGRRSPPSGRMSTVTLGSSDLTCLAFSPNGRLLAAGSINFSDLALWNVGSWTPDAQIAYSDGVPGTGLSFSPDGRYVAVVSNGFLQLCDLNVGASRDLGPALGGAFASCAEFSPDGATLAVGTSSGAVSLLATSDWSSRREIAGADPSGLVRLTFSPDGKKLITGADDGAVRVWSSAGEPLSTSPVGAQIHTMELVSQDVVCVGMNGKAELWDLSTSSRRGTFQTDDGPVVGLAVHPHAGYVATCDQSENVSVWSVSDQKPALRLPASSNGLSVAFSPDAEYLVSGQFDGTVVVWQNLQLPS